MALETTEVSIDATAIHYRGSITNEANARLVEVASASDFSPSQIVVTSKGGDVLAGIALGDWIFSNRLDVSVPEYCVSSCANYVFIAGNRKTLSSGSLLVWHGGALQEDWDLSRLCPEKDGDRSPDECEEDRIREMQEQVLLEWQDKEKRFFSMVGVDQRITVLGQDPKYDCRGGRSGYLGWYYSLDDLSRMGVQNVTVVGGQWMPEPPSPRAKICRVPLGPEYSFQR